MSVKQWLSDIKQSDWFLFYVSLSLTVILGIIVGGSYLAKFALLFVASGIFLFVSLIPLWFGILQGFFGRPTMSPAIRRVTGLILLLLLSMGFFWALSMITVTDSTSWMKDGTSTVIAGIIGALAYDIMTKPYGERT